MRALWNLLVNLASGTPLSWAMALAWLIGWSLAHRLGWPTQTTAAASTALVAWGVGVPAPSCLLPLPSRGVGTMAPRVLVVVALGVALGWCAARGRAWAVGAAAGAWIFVMLTSGFALLMSETSRILYGRSRPATLCVGALGYAGVREHVVVAIVAAAAAAVVSIWIALVGFHGRLRYPIRRTTVDRALGNGTGPASP